MNTIDEAAKLISIASITGNEGDIGRYLDKKFRAMGCQTELIEVVAGRFNVLAVIPGVESKRIGVLFHGHMDTVAPYGMVSPFEPLIEEHCLLGRGSVDQKGGIAAVISAFERTLQGQKLARSVGFIGVIDEEAEHRGSMAMQEMSLAAECAVVTEPSGLKLGIGCKGTMPYKISVRGKSAHGCRPWLGKNAVVYGMQIAHELLHEELPVSRIEGVGEARATLNLGMMQGGVAYNIVPDECTLWFDRRTVPCETQEEVLQAVQETLKKYNRIPDISVQAEIARPDWNWEPIRQRGLMSAMTDINAELVHVVKNAHREHTGALPEIYFTDGYNEMDFLINDLGIPTVQYGPGDGGLCHTDQERLDIRQLETAASVYHSIINMTCGRTNNA
jgi:acetylornithine deacetylase/succinyl-diaminopimelate desuccinylase